MCETVIDSSPLYLGLVLGVRWVYTVCGFLLGQIIQHISGYRVI